MGFELSKKKIITIAAIVVIVAAALYIVYDLNGKSLDLQNRETRIVVTNSMDGNVHPDGYWHCNNEDCGIDWIPKTSSTHPTCPHCGYNNAEHVDKAFDIEKISVNSLIMIKKLDDTQKQDIQIGDVIAFNWNNRLTVHRVIDIKTNGAEVTGFITKGDNASGTESPSLAAVSGVVVGESGWLGSVIHFAQSSTILFVMMIVILVVIVSVICDIFRIRNRS